MDEQLQWVTSLLSAHGVKYWVDSGSLLGLMREGRLLPNDRDIDISIWKDDAAKLSDLARSARKAGYNILSRSWKGDMHKLKFIPKDMAGMRKIDISIFQKSPTHAWCPATFAPTNPYPRGSAMYYVAKAARRPIVVWWSRFDSRGSIDSLLTKRVGGFGTWWIPLKFFATLTRSTAFEVNIPDAWQDYLTFRYGDWRTPVQSWDYRYQDGAFVRQPPHKLLQA